MVDVTATVLCPLCPWDFEPPGPEAPADAGVAAMLDTTADALTSLHERQRQRRVEAYIRSHLEQHPLEEWAAEVRRLKEQLANAGTAV